MVDGNYLSRSMYNCGEKIRRIVQFCWKCHADQSKIGPLDWSGGSKADPTSSQPSTSFGRPNMNNDQTKKAVKLFVSYVKGKRSEQQGGCQFQKNKKKKIEDVNVTVNIG